MTVVSISYFLHVLWYPTTLINSVLYNTVKQIENVSVADILGYWRKSDAVFTRRAGILIFSIQIYVALCSMDLQKLTLRIFPTILNRLVLSSLL